MFEIKKASELDAQALTDLARRTFVDTFANDNHPSDIGLYLVQTFSVEKQRDEIRDAQRRIEMAWANNTAIGFLHLVQSEPDRCVITAKPIELLRLYVDSNWHGQGVGTALMQKSIALARDEGFKTIWLGVWERNFKAQAFYLRHGFATVGSHGFRLGTEQQIDLIMARTI